MGFELILLQVITFVVIILVLRSLFGAQLKSALARLQLLHQENLDKEEILNKELERAKVQSENEIARAKEEAKQIVEAARASAEKIAQETSEHAHLEIQKILTEANARAQKLEGEILASVDDKALKLAEDLIRYTFTQKGLEILHASLIDALIEDFQDIDKSQLAMKSDKAEVSCPIALTQEEKQKLQGILADKLGHSVSLEEKSDPGLIAGLIIQLGGLVVDGSLKSKLAKSLAAMRQKKT